MADQLSNLLTSALPAGSMPRTATIPTGIAQAGLVSTTSLAADCFIKQQFSAKLQAFMIGYVNGVMSYYSVYR